MLVTKPPLWKGAGGVFATLVFGVLLGGGRLRGQPGVGVEISRAQSAEGAAVPATVGHADQKSSSPTRLTHVRAAELRSLRILPSSITLSKPLASQRLVVEGQFNDGHSEDLTSLARVSSSNPAVASVGPQSLIQAEGDGQSLIKAGLGGRSASAQVTVENFGTATGWSFRSHVLPVMTKAGCNSGACHGAAAGKNGFKLTLRGYDPEADYYTLTHQALDRRVVRLEPAKSLILLKPTLTVAHGGGQRFAVGSPEYQVIAGWIAAGMAAPKETDPRIKSLEVLPRQVSLLPGAKQQILVRARFTDGHTEDVTRWAKYASTDESVASVDQDGLVKMNGHGEAPVTVWYLNLVAAARVTVPFPNELNEAEFRQAARHNYIDDLVLKKLQQLHIPPSRPASDAEFIRRAYLDAAGILPTADETERFLADPSPGKRARLIDKLLTRPEFVDYWAYKWSDLLLVSSLRLSPTAMWSYYRWIRGSVAANKPWDQFVREVVTASGGDTENPAVNYFVIHRDPSDVSESLAQAFLGMSMKCAHCHNHPMERWTQNDYYSMANFFSRVQVKDNRAAAVGGSAVSLAVVSTSVGDLYHPRLGRALAPCPPGGQPLALDSQADRRAYFAEWLTSPHNTQFAEAVVNRVWKNFLGVGLIEPADDVRDTNPPTNDELFTALTTDFVKHGFDVQYLIRTIMESATYQTSSEADKLNAQDTKYYSHYFIRRLSAEVLLDALSEVTHDPEKFSGFPAGTRALQLPDVRMDSYFLSIFGRPQRLQTSESERQSDPSVIQALDLINGDTMNKKLGASGGTVDMLVKLGLSNDRALDYLYLSAFSRYPQEVERRKIIDSLEKAQQNQEPAWGQTEARRRVLQDFLWAMVTSKEFIFQQ